LILLLGKNSQKTVIEICGHPSQDGQNEGRRAMWKNQEGHPVKLNNAERPLAGDDVAGMLADLNEQCLALLAEQALHPIPPSPPMFRELVDLWSQLDVHSRRRAAVFLRIIVDDGEHAGGITQGRAASRIAKV